MAISGSIVNTGDVMEITYSNTIQEFEVPVDGLYKLEVYGASGGKATSTVTTSISSPGGKGGYATGYKLFAQGTRLYICTGGAAGDVKNWNDSRSGGYNGGGTGARSESFAADTRRMGAGGGGATHVALVTGLLSSLSNNVGDILIVAGGGGGGGCGFKTGSDPDPFTPIGTGGTGGGDAGGNGVGYSGGGGTVVSTGGTQNGGSGFGKGGDAPSGEGRGGGGGGYYGGNVVSANACGGGGAGGSGYIGGVPEITFNGNTYTPEMQNGINSGNGYAKITLVAAGGEHTAYIGDIPAMFFLGDAEFNPFI